MRVSLRIPHILCWISLAAAPLAQAQLPIIQEKVALSGELDQYRGIYPTTLAIRRLNADGTVIFSDNAFPDTRVYSGGLAGVTRRLVENTIASDRNGAAEFNLGGSNESGQVALVGSNTLRSSVYLLTGNALRALVAGGSDAAGDGLFTVFGTPALDAAGHVAFRAETSGSGSGLFLVVPTATASIPKQLALVGQPAPGGGNFASFLERLAVLSSSTGEITVFFNATTDGGKGLYVAQTDDTAAPVLKRIATGLHEDFALNDAGKIVYSDANGIYVADFVGSTPLAQLNAPAPGGGKFSWFGAGAINQGGTVVFRAATVQDGEPGQGIFLRTATGLSLIARQDQAIGTDKVALLGAPQINEFGLIAFAAQLTQANGNSTGAIFLTDGVTLLKAVSTGDALQGSTIAAGGFGQTLLVHPDSLNRSGQVAFAATLANGKSGVFLATPTSHFKSDGPGIWEDGRSWDFGIVPGQDSPVAIDSATDARLQGPVTAAVTKIRTLTIGGGAGTATLAMTASSTLTASKGAQVLDHGVLAGSGTIGTSLKMLPGARLQVNLGGSTRTSSPAFDFIKVDGAATLAGTLEVGLANGFMPARGQSFDVLDFKTRVGVFSSIQTPPLLPAGLTWDTTTGSTTGTVTVSGATLFLPSKGVFAGNLLGSSGTPATSGSVLLTLAANGQLTGSFMYGGVKYVVPATILNVDGTASIKFGTPPKFLEVRLQTVDGAPQLAASVTSGGGLAESQAVAAQTNGTFPATSPLVGHYTIALPPDPAHTESTYPGGTGYATITVSSLGTASMTALLPDSTVITASGPLTAAGEFPFYASAYLNKGFVSGKLTLHGSTPNDPVEGTVRWAHPVLTTGLFKTAFDANITVLGSGYRLPVAPAKIISLPGDQGAFHTTGGNIGALPDKAVSLNGAYAFKANSGGAFTLSFPTLSYGVGTGSFRDAAGKARTINGVVLQKQKLVLGLFTGTDNSGTFEIQ